MERIAIISDIHGNLEALKAVLNDIKSRKIKRIFCLGDIIAKGVHPKECLDLIKEECEIILLGNCEYFFCKEHGENISNFTEENQKRIKWNQSMLPKEDRNFLLQLPYSFEFYMSGSLIRLFHATPTIINGLVSSIDSLEDKYKLFLPSKHTSSNKTADIVIYGHTHMPYLDKFYNKTLVNCGSVGNAIDVLRNNEKDSLPIETTQACYLILEGDYNSREHQSSLSFQFVRLPYNIEKELNTDKENIERKAYQEELRKGKYREMERIKKLLENKNIHL